MLGFLLSGLFIFSISTIFFWDKWDTEVSGYLRLGAGILDLAATVWIYIDLNPIVNTFGIVPAQYILGAFLVMTTVLTLLSVATFWYWWRSGVENFSRE